MQVHTGSSNKTGHCKSLHFNDLDITIIEIIKDKVVVCSNNRWICYDDENVSQISTSSIRSRYQQLIIVLLQIIVIH